MNIICALLSGIFIGLSFSIFNFSTTTNLTFRIPSVLIYFCLLPLLISLNKKEKSKIGLEAVRQLAFVAKKRDLERDNEDEANISSSEICSPKMTKAQPKYRFCSRNWSCRTASLGLITGLTGYSIIFYWVIPTIIAAGEHLFIGILCIVLLSIYMSIYLIIFLIIYSYTITSTIFLPTEWRGIKGEVSKVLTNLYLSGIWVSLEYIRSYIFTGFPWAIFGYSQWNFLEIIQVSGITGVYGISFLIIFMNLSLTDFIIKKRYISLLPGLILFFIFYFYGVISLNRIDTRNEIQNIKVSVLQGNIDQYKKWDQQYKQQTIDTYSLLAKDTSKYKPDMIIFPETALPGCLFLEQDIYHWLGQLVNKTKCFYLVGSGDWKDNKFYNSCFLISPDMFSKKTHYTIKNGRIIPSSFRVQSYSKIHLVPFGEIVPFQKLLSGWIKVLNELGGTQPGTEYTVFELNSPSGQKDRFQFATSICFESIFPSVIKKIVKKDAQFLVNITNDAWFLKTSAPYQHFVFNVFRAVENRRQLIRCANTGISGLIDEYGRILVQTKIFEINSKTFFVKPIKNVKTFYTKYGDIFSIFFLVLGSGTAILQFCIKYIRKMS